MGIAIEPGPACNDHMIAQGFTENAAVRALAAANGALCTIVTIEGSYSRRIGVQLAVLEDGSIVGSLADGCLEAQLAHEARKAAGGTACLRRFGKGSPLIDYRLPCGAGIDVVIDPQSDRTAIEVLQTGRAHIGIPSPYA